MLLRVAMKVWGKFTEDMEVESVACVLKMLDVPWHELFFS